MNESQCYENTDKEIWREKPGDYYSDSIHVTEGGGIGIDCGGHVIVAPLRRWHEAGELIFCINNSNKFFKWKRKIAMWLLRGNRESLKRKILEKNKYGKTNCR